MTASVALFVALSLAAAPASETHMGGQSGVDSSRYSCGTGRIRNVQSIGEPVPATWRQRPTESAVAVLRSESEPGHQYFLITVQFNGMHYVIRASADVSWNLDPMTFRLDESTGVCVNTGDMVLDRLDGTDFRGRVIRVADHETPFVAPVR